MEKNLTVEYPNDLNFLYWRIPLAGGVSSYLFQPTVNHCGLKALGNAYQGPLAVVA